MINVYVFISVWYILSFQLIDISVCHSILWTWWSF